jgi:hypothetical protein
MALIVILKVSFLRSYYDDQGHIVPEQSTADQVAYDQTPPGNDRMEREHQDNIQVCNIAGNWDTQLTISIVHGFS